MRNSNAFSSNVLNNSNSNKNDCLELLGVINNSRTPFYQLWSKRGVVKNSVLTFMI